MDQTLPIGPLVDPAPAPRPERVTLPGRFVTLVPLEAAHADELFDAAGAAGHEHLWVYMPDGPFTDRAAFAENIARKAASTDPLFFAILDKATNRAVGHASFLRIEPAHRVIEVGNIMYGSPLQRTPGATESMALLAAYVFDRLGYRRYEWKCNALNAPSRTAAARLGFTFEGIFRQHMIVKTRNRDTAWFSMLDSEWPACHAAFERWLAPGNFDASGRQLQSLAELRTPTAE
jgi:RimJ/RimL family protein N-acetyltransferase